jgi:Caspase domain
MYKVLTHLVLLCIVGIMIALVDRIPAEAYDIYYLSVGNSKYRDNNLDIPDANLSAHGITRYLRWARAVDGITLVSQQSEYVTRDDVLGALGEIARKAKAARDPLVVYYFVGHGASRGEGWSHVSFVGNYKSSDPVDVAPSRAIVETQEIQELLENQDLPFILILDNCYYRQPEGLSPIWQTIQRGMVEAAMIVMDRANRSLRIEHTMDPAIIFYAAKPGLSVQTLPHPSNEFNSIGPLARRLLLLFDEAFKSETGLSVGRFHEKMNDLAFDPKSIPGHHREWISNSGEMLIPAGARAESTEGVGEIRRGTGGGAGHDR